MVIQKISHSTCKTDPKTSQGIYNKPCIDTICQKLGMMEKKEILRFKDTIPPQERNKNDENDEDY